MLTNSRASEVGVTGAKVLLDFEICYFPIKFLATNTRFQLRVVETTILPLLTHPMQKSSATSGKSSIGPPPEKHLPTPVLTI